MYILITRDTYNGTFVTRTFSTEQDVLTVLRDEMLDAVKRYPNDKSDYDMVMDLFDILPSVEPGFTHANAYFRIRRNQSHIGWSHPYGS